jgi:hypothetical protein
MPGKVLTTGSGVQCPHGGQASLMTANQKASTMTGKVLLETDIHTVAGCAFTIGTKPSPCIRIEWKAGATKVKANSTAILLQSSVGLCYSPEGAPQGPATVTQADTKASAQ